MTSKVSVKNTRIGGLGPVAVVRLTDGHGWAPGLQAWPFHLYEATRAAWKKTPASGDFTKATIVLSAHNGTVYEAYRVAGWFDANSTMNSKPSKPHENGRKEFVGNVVDDSSIRALFINASIKNLFKRGNQTPIRVFAKLVRRHNELISV